MNGRGVILYIVFMSSLMFVLSMNTDYYRETRLLLHVLYLLSVFIYDCSFYIINTCIPLTLSSRTCCSHETSVRCMPQSRHTTIYPHNTRGSSGDTMWLQR